MSEEATPAVSESTNPVLNPADPVESTPAEWLPEGLKDNPYLKDYASVEEVLHEYASLKEARENGDMGDYLKLTDNPEDLAKVFAKLGKPENSEGYQFEKPEGFEKYVAEENLKQFNDLALEANLTQAQYEKVMGFVGELTQHSAVTEDEPIVANISKLVERWGHEDTPGFKANQKLAIDGYNGVKDPYVTQLVKDDPVWSTHPGTLELMAWIGKQLSTDTPAKSTSAETRTFSQAGDPDTRIEQFRKQHAKALNDMSDQDHSRRYQELIALYAEKHNIKV